MAHEFDHLFEASKPVGEFDHLFGGSNDIIQNEGSLATDIPKALIRGAAQIPEVLAEPIQAGASYVGKSIDQTGLPSRLGMRSAQDNIDYTGGVIRDNTTRALAKKAEEVLPYSQGTQQAQEQLGQDIQGLIANPDMGIGEKVYEGGKAALLNPRGVLPSVIESAPQFIGGAGALKALGVGNKAIEAAKAQQALGKVGAVEKAQKANTLKTSVGLNAALEGFGGSQGAREDIQKTDINILRQQPAFADLEAKYGTEQAIKLASERAGTEAYLPSGVLGGAASLVTGGGAEAGLINKLINRPVSNGIINPTAKGILGYAGKEVGKSALREIPEETLQGISGQLGQNIGEQQYTGVPLTQGLAEQAGLGAVSGALGGVAYGGAGLIGNEITGNGPLSNALRKVTPVQIPPDSTNPIVQRLGSSQAFGDRSQTGTGTTSNVRWAKQLKNRLGDTNATNETPTPDVNKEPQLRTGQTGANSTQLSNQPDLQDQLNAETYTSTGRTGDVIEETSGPTRGTLAIPGEGEGANVSGGGFDSTGQERRSLLGITSSRKKELEPQENRSINPKSDLNVQQTSQSLSAPIDRSKLQDTQVGDGDKINAESTGNANASGLIGQSLVHDRNVSDRGVGIDESNIKLKNFIPTHTLDNENNLPVRATEYEHTYVDQTGNEYYEPDYVTPVKNEPIQETKQPSTSQQDAQGTDKDATIVNKPGVQKTIPAEPVRKIGGVVEGLTDEQAKVTTINPTIPSEGNGTTTANVLTGQGTGAKQGEEEVKQPWQMTRDEFIDANDAYEDITGWYGSEPQKQADQLYKEAQSLRETGIKKNKDIAKDLEIQADLIGEKWVDDNSHDKQVKKALSEGKPVPQEVLNDYPGLTNEIQKVPNEANAESSIPMGSQAKPESNETEDVATPSDNTQKVSNAIANSKGQIQFTKSAAEKILTSNAPQYKDVTADTHEIVAADNGKYSVVPKQQRRKGIIGDKLAAGERVLTVSGRETTPFPKFTTSTGKTTQKHVNEVDKWLMQNALDEAESRGDEFNALQFRANKDKPQKTDKDSAEYYLFEEQQKVPKPFLKPLLPEIKVEQKSTKQTKDEKETTGTEAEASVTAKPIAENYKTPSEYHAAVLAWKQSANAVPIEKSQDQLKLDELNRKVALAKKANDRILNKPQGAVPLSIGQDAFRNANNKYLKLVEERDAHVAKMQGTTSPTPMVEEQVNPPLVAELKKRKFTQKEIDEINAKQTDVEDLAGWARARFKGDDRIKGLDLDAMRTVKYTPPNKSERAVKQEDVKQDVENDPASDMSQEEIDALLNQFVSEPDKVDKARKESSRVTVNVNKPEEQAQTKSTKRKTVSKENAAHLFGQDKKIGYGKENKPFSKAENAQKVIDKKSTLDNHKVIQSGNDYWIVHNNYPMQDVDVDAAINKPSTNLVNDTNTPKEEEGVVSTNDQENKDSVTNDNGDTFKVGDVVSYKNDSKRKDIVTAIRKGTFGGKDVMTEEIDGKRKGMSPEGSTLVHVVTEKQSDRDNTLKAAKDSGTEPTPEMAKLDADIDDLLGEIGQGILSRLSMKAVPEEEVDLLPLISKLMGLLVKKGYLTFEANAHQVIALIRDKFGDKVADNIHLDELKGGYIGMRKGTTSQKDVVAYDSIEQLEKDYANTKYEGTNEVQEMGSNGTEKVRTGRKRNVAGNGENTTTAGNESVLEDEQEKDVPKTQDNEPSGQAGTSSGVQDVGTPSTQPGGGDTLAGQQESSGTGLVTDGTGDRGNLVDKELVNGDNKTKLGNYHITDPEALIGGSPKVRFARNKKAIETYQNILDENREPTEEERDVIAAYIGWGSFGQDLFQGTWEKNFKREGWEEENAWLREHLGESAWKSAQSSIINAHYTDPPTVKSLWDIAAKLGFNGGRVLEPSMGIGNFFGLMPRDMMERSELTGIELDETTGGMAKMLYPDANIQVKGYQDSKTADDFYDLVIGNWPFAAQSPSDRRYNKLGASLHDYFFIKALDQVRPGGLVIGITSAGTMDKIGRVARSEMHKKGVVVSAFRMPMGAFDKYAGTSVVADIIIMQKRGEGVAETIGDSWLESVPLTRNGELVTRNDGSKVNVNEYWSEHPDNVLGNMTVGHGTTTFRDGMIVERQSDYPEVLAKLADRLPQDIMTKRELGKKISYITNNTKDRQNSVVTGEDGNLYVVQGDRLALLSDIHKYAVKNEKETATREQEIKDVVGIRKTYGELLDAERSGANNAEELRKSLNAQYKSFVSSYGNIAKSKSLAILKKVQDPFYPAIAALEHNTGTKQKPVYSPARILTKTTMRGKSELENPSVSDAFVLVRNESAEFIDIDRIAKLSKKPVVDVEKELLESGALYKTPSGNHEVSDIYLSGNVRRKLREALEAQSSGQDMTRNIEALKKVLPKDTPYFAIEASLGANWISADHYKQFIADLLGVTGAEINDIKPILMPKGWRVEMEGWLNQKPEAKTIWGVPFYPFSKIVNSAFSGASITIKAKDENGNDYVNEEATKQANEKVDKLREEFKNWVWKDSERRIALEKAFNETMNAFSSPNYDGSFMNFEGIALQRGDNEFSLRSHQVNAIWRGIANGRGLYAHEVGTGKSYTIAGIAIESRRYGMAKKPLVFAHNANSSSLASDIQSMYPGAKVLYIDNLSPSTIKQRLYQIANDDWDAVVVPHSLVDRFALSKETMMELAARDIAALEENAIASAQEEGFDITEILNDEEALRNIRGASTAKQLVKERNAIIEKINKMADKASREDAINFEQLGVDMLIIDEVHEFKKPPLSTRMNVKGLNKSASGEGIAMNFLTTYVRNLNGGKGVHTFTGTPITNTLNEIYNQMRYVMGDAMDDAGVAEWDSWFNTFAGVVSDVELTATGEYESVSKLTGFYNVAELRKFAGQYMDIVFADEMPEFVSRTSKAGKSLHDSNITESERDELINGRTENPEGRPYKKVINEAIQMSDTQKGILRELVALSRMFKAADKKTRRQLRNHISNPVLVDTEAAKASFDARLYDINSPDHHDSKINRVVGNVIKHYNEHDKATQVIFMDKGYNDTAERTRRGSDGFRLMDANGKSIKETVPTFNAAKDIVKKLVEQGIPAEQIAVVTGSTSKEKRKEIADNMNSGKIRVVIGGTQTLGVGVNMQENLRAMHHLDAPWMPGELEQRNGRGHRQGNKWNTVLEYRYLTEGIDGRRWQVLAIKQKFITAFLKADEDTRVIEGDAVDMSDSEGIDDISASLSAAAGDPRLLMREKLKSDVNKLENKQRTHDYGISDAKEAASKLKRRIDLTNARIKNSSNDAAHVLSNKDKPFSIEIKGKTYTERKDVNDAIAKAYGEANIGDMIGSINGFEIHARRDNLLKLSRMDDYEASPSIASIEANLRNISKHVEKDRQIIEESEQSIIRMEQAAKTPFGQADALKKKKAMLEQIMVDLDLYPAPAPAWLREGAPVGTDAYLEGGKKVTVQGHRWGNDNWFVLVDDDKGEATPLPYTDIMDENNMPVYETIQFQQPVTANVQASQAIISNDYRVSSTSPNGVTEGSLVVSTDNKEARVIRAFIANQNGDKDRLSDWMYEVEYENGDRDLVSASDYLPIAIQASKADKPSSTNTHTTTSLKTAMQQVMDKEYGAGWFERLLATGKFKIINSSIAKQMAGVGSLFHAAWHGSPHDHMGFDSSKIGTGEGAQAFGYGHYFTDLKRIGEWYRDKLTQTNIENNFKLDGKFVFNKSQDYSFNLSDNERPILLRIQNKLEEGKKTIDDAISSVRSDLIAFNENPLNRHNQSFKDFDTTLKSLESRLSFIVPTGKLYNVELAPEQDQYLDWDKPLSEQSELVKNALKKAIKTGNLQGHDNETLSENDIVNFNGKDIYKAVKSAQYNEAEASSYLHSIGIRGIRYKAEAGKSEANNYVVFDDADIKIVAKYSRDGKTIQAFYNPDNDTTYFVADNIDKGVDLFKLAQHEIGVHALTLGQSDAEFQKIMEDMLKLVQTSKPLQTAYTKALESFGIGEVPTKGKPINGVKREDVLHELAGYLVEKYPNLSRVKKLIAWMRNAIRNLGKTLPALERMKWVKWANSLNEKDIQFLAISALRSAPEKLIDPSRVSSNSVIANTNYASGRLGINNFISYLSNNLNIGIGINVSTASLVPKANINKSIPNNITTAIKSLANIAKTKPVIEHGFSNVNINIQKLMFNNMVSMSHNDKIIDAIVKLVPINVMNNVISGNFSPNMLLHNEPMFADSFSINSNKPVSLDNTTIDSIANAFTIVATELSSFMRRTSNSFDGGSTDATGNKRGSSSFINSGASLGTKSQFTDSLSGLKLDVALRTITDRHGVTPISNIMLGDNAVDAALSPSIISKNKKESGNLLASKKENAQSYSAKDKKALEELFTSLSPRAKPATRTAALERINNFKDSDKIRYVEDNFYDMLGALEESGKVVIKC